MDPQPKWREVLRDVTGILAVASPVIVAIIEKL
jgi:hypothetical protein